MFVLKQNDALFCHKFDIKTKLVNFLRTLFKVLTNRIDKTVFLPLFLLTLSAFTSATILPGSSEAALVTFLWKYPHAWFIALLLAGIGNTAGSMTSYALTRVIPHKKKFSEKYLHLLQKYGTSLLFFSFVPIVGDTLPLAAGWLRLPVWRCVFFIGLGKFSRYGVILLGWWALLPE